MIKPHIRAIIAATALSHTLGKKLTSIYQYGGDSGFKSVSIDISGKKVTGYDYTTGSHFSGTIPSLYHYGEGCHVEFKDKGGGKYTGFVYGEGGHYEVKVKGKSASFYDYGGSGWTEFST